MGSTPSVPAAPAPLAPAPAAPPAVVDFFSRTLTAQLTSMRTFVDPRLHNPSPRPAPNGTDAALKPSTAKLFSAPASHPVDAYDGAGMGDGDGGDDDNDDDDDDDDNSPDVTTTTTDNTFSGISIPTSSLRADPLNQPLSQAARMVAKRAPLPVPWLGPYPAGAFEQTPPAPTPAPELNEQNTIPLTARQASANNFPLPLQLMHDVCQDLCDLHTLTKGQREENEKDVADLIQITRLAMLYDEHAPGVKARYRAALEVAAAEQRGRRRAKEEDRWAIRAVAWLDASFDGLRSRLLGYREGLGFQQLCVLLHSRRFREYMRLTDRWISAKGVERTTVFRLIRGNVGSLEVLGRFAAGGGGTAAPRRGRRGADGAIDTGNEGLDWRARLLESNGEAGLIRWCVDETVLGKMVDQKTGKKLPPESFNDPAIFGARGVVMFIKHVATDYFESTDFILTKITDKEASKFAKLYTVATMDNKDDEKKKVLGHRHEWAFMTDGRNLLGLRFSREPKVPLPKGSKESIKRHIDESVWANSTVPKADPRLRTEFEAPCVVCGHRVGSNDGKSKKGKGKNAEYCKCTLEQLITSRPVVEIRQYPVPTDPASTEPVPADGDDSSEALPVVRNSVERIGVRTLSNLPARTYLDEFVGEFTSVNPDHVTSDVSKSIRYHCSLRVKRLNLKVNQKHDGREDEDGDDDDDNNGDSDNNENINTNINADKDADADGSNDNGAAAEANADDAEADAEADADDDIARDDAEEVSPPVTKTSPEASNSSRRRLRPRPGAPGVTHRQTVKKPAKKVKAKTAPLQELKDSVATAPNSTADKDTDPSSTDDKPAAKSKKASKAGKGSRKRTLSMVRDMYEPSSEELSEMPPKVRKRNPNSASPQDGTRRSQRSRVPSQRALDAAADAAAAPARSARASAAPSRAASVRPASVVPPVPPASSAPAARKPAKDKKDKVSGNDDTDTANTGKADAKKTSKKAAAAASKDSTPSEDDTPAAQPSKKGKSKATTHPQGKKPAKAASTAKGSKPAVAVSKGKKVALKVTIPISEGDDSSSSSSGASSPSVSEWVAPPSTAVPVVRIDAKEVGNWTRYVSLTTDASEANVEFITVSVGSLRRIVLRVKDRAIGWGNELITCSQDGVPILS